MSELIERLRARVAHEKTIPSVGHNAADRERAELIVLLNEAAAALEAAREDAERYRWLLTKGKLPVRCSAGYYYEDGVTYPTAEAAIDQARGKGGQ